jgi:1,4-alpha-glucan branching enzyme
METNMSTLRRNKLIAVRLEFHDEQARTVCIAGTFNDWHPKTTTMRTTGSGHWITELALSPGIYEYQYVVDGRWINDPQAVKSTPNPFGGRNSVLVVEQDDTTPGPSSSRATPNATLPEKRSRS